MKIQYIENEGYIVTVWPDDEVDLIAIDKELNGADFSLISPDGSTIKTGEEVREELIALLDADEEAEEKFCRDLFSDLKNKDESRKEGK